MGLTEAISVSYNDTGQVVSTANVTNLNEPPRALAASTIVWVRSCSIPYGLSLTKKNTHLILAHNFGKSWQILILSPSDSAVTV